ITIFQSRDNTSTLSLGASSVTGVTGTIYAAAALVSVGGSAQVKIPVIVNRMTINGNGGTPLTASGFAAPVAEVDTQLFSKNIVVYVTDPTHVITASELTSIHRPVEALTPILRPYHVAPEAALANLFIDMAPTSASGGSADGILGSYTATAGHGDITLIQGW